MLHNVLPQLNVHAENKNEKKIKIITFNINAKISLLRTLGFSGK